MGQEIRGLRLGNAENHERRAVRLVRTAPVTVVAAGWFAARCRAGRAGCSGEGR